MSRFLKGVFAFSVLLNLLLAGVILGTCGRHLLFNDSDHHRPGFPEVAQALPADKRAGFEDTMHAADKDTVSLRQQLADGRKQASRLLKADPFDKSAYLAQMEKNRQLRLKVMQRMAEAVAQAAGSLSQDERAVLADTLAHPHPGDN